MADVFELTELERDSSSVVIIDLGGTILWTNEAWTRFARENGGESVPERFGPGRSYFAGISGPLREFFQGAFESALLTKTVFEHEYECSSADEYRLMHLRALPVPGGELLLQHSIVAEHPQDHASSTEQETRYRTRDGMVVQCSNCRRFRRGIGFASGWQRCHRTRATASARSAGTTITGSTFANRHLHNRRRGADAGRRGAKAKAA
jgi:hypothetical protein